VPGLGRVKREKGKKGVWVREKGMGVGVGMGMGLCRVVEGFGLEVGLGMI
jgi:hypothetical protein